ncbi:MAG: hypothetical protein WA749_11525 [Gelidibacter sp.]
MKDLLKFDFCEMHIYDSYLIVIINEGLVVEPKHNRVLTNVADAYFKNRHFIYITHRINSYSVDPATYIETSKIRNLQGFAVVSKNFKAKSNVEVEKLFFINKPFESFDDLNTAVSWAKSLLEL